MLDNKGLTLKEVKEARYKYGSNELNKAPHRSFGRLLLDSFGDPIIKILLIALAIRTLFLLSNFDWYETVGVAISILLASFISTISEYGSEAAFKRLQEEASKLKCKVYRNYILKEIYINEVVKNDLILIQAGDKIPADGLLISGSIAVDESPLSGESKEINKNVIDNNKLFRGSIISAGEGKMLVTAVGNNTVYGHLAVELQDEQRDSPLKTKLHTLAKVISKIGYIGAFLVVSAHLFNVLFIQYHFDFLIINKIIRQPPLMLSHLLYAITLAVTVIIVAVPEGLPMMITVVLSSNMKKMIKDNVLVRKMVGIETSGGINILFADKTGTITKGHLVVQQFLDGQGKTYEINKLNKYSELLTIIKKAIFYNNASIYEPKSGQVIGGNATDKALMEGFKQYFNSLDKELTIKQIAPFDSKNKISVTYIEEPYYLYLIKGAPEKIISHCDSYYNQKGQITSLIKKTKLKDVIDKETIKGVRFIALATSKKPINSDYLSNQLTLVGLINIKDEIRKEAKMVIKEVEEAGIQVIMLTGDAKNTAKAVAKEIGLLKDNDYLFTSEELNKLDDDYLKKIIPKLKVVARALPQDKSKLIKLAQELGMVVGMTGDGINDAPALKKADVGFAMGSGTEIAKEASDIVILDNNLKSIAKAVLYGRTIFKSIRKFIILQLTINLCALGLSIIGPFIGIESPITVVQMLWINLIMDTLAALAFAGEPALKEYMKELPKKRNEPIINNYMIRQILFTGGYSLLLCLFFLKSPFIAHLFDYHQNDAYLMTAFFALFIFVGIFNSLNARTHRLNLLAYIIYNKSFILIMGLICFIQILIIYKGGSLFRVIGLSIKELWFVIFLAFTVIPIDWFRKIHLRTKKQIGGV